MYEPTSARLAVVKSRISPESWEARVEAARRDAEVLGEVTQRACGGVSLNQAVREIVPENRRSWVMRHIDAFRREGWEALIDERVPREPQVAKDAGPLIEAAREASPKVTADEVIGILRKQPGAVLPSRTTIKRHFRRVDERRQRAAGREAAAKEVVEMPLAGGELLLAAEAETGAIGALTDEVLAIAEEAKKASKGREPR